MNGDVTTVVLWVCACGRVDRIDGGVSSSSYDFCQVRPDGKHYFKQVLVVVPIP